MVSVVGAFKLDHLRPLHQILFQKFSNFQAFILGSPLIITPEEIANGAAFGIEKRELNGTPRIEA